MKNDIVSLKMTFELEDELLLKQIILNLILNFKLGNSEIRIIGDKTILILIVKLLAYIRHAILNNQKSSIQVDICLNVLNSQFSFDVNLLPIDDLITQKLITIS